MSLSQHLKILLYRMIYGQKVKAESSIQYQSATDFGFHQGSRSLVPVSRQALSHLSTDSRLGTMELTSALNAHLVCTLQVLPSTLTDWFKDRMLFQQHRLYCTLCRLWKI